MDCFERLSAQVQSTPRHLPCCQRRQDMTLMVEALGNNLLPLKLMITWCFGRIERKNPKRLLVNLRAVLSSIYFPQGYRENCSPGGRELK
jgi:hypothetical protein